MGEIGGDEAAWAVAAHGLLAFMAVIVGSVTTVLDHSAQLAEPEWREFLSTALVHARFVSDALSDLTRGLPVPAVEALEALTAGRPDQNDNGCDPAVGASASSRS